MYIDSSSGSILSMGTVKKKPFVVLTLLTNYSLFLETAALLGCHVLHVGYRDRHVVELMGGSFIFSLLANFQCCTITA